MMMRRVLASLLSVAVLALATAAAAVDGNPVAGVGVSVEQSPGGIVIANTKTDAKGVAKFDVRQPGTYVVRYTEGPDKGKIAQTLTVPKAGPASVTLTSTTAKTTPAPARQ